MECQALGGTNHISLPVSEPWSFVVSLVVKVWLPSVAKEKRSVPKVSIFLMCFKEAQVQNLCGQEKQDLYILEAKPTYS